MEIRERERKRAIHILPVSSRSVGRCNTPWRGQGCREREGEKDGDKREREREKERETYITC